MPSASSTSLTVTATRRSSLPAPRVISDREQADRRRHPARVSQYTGLAPHHDGGHCEEVAQLILPTSRNTFFYQNFNWPGAEEDAAAGRRHRRARAAPLLRDRGLAGHAAQHAVARAAGRRLRDEGPRLAAVVREHDQAAVRAALRGARQLRGAELQQLAVARRVRQFDDVTSTSSTRRWHRGARACATSRVPFGETFYGENHQGKVDRIIRWFRLTAYQAVQKWGRAALPQNLSRRSSRTASGPTTSCIASSRAARTTTRGARPPLAAVLLALRLDRGPLPDAAGERLSRVPLRGVALRPDAGRGLRPRPGA
jgi:hypothetical protein